jgi:uncharacterized protein YndB with AHSA1/START domain
VAGQYDFLTTWCVDAPIESVWDALHDSQRYPQWWKGVRSVVEIEPGEPSGLGALSRFSWRSVLPYTLEFDLRIVRVERPHVLEGRADGELAGTGTWMLYEGRGTAVVYRWQVRTTQRWMNALGPLARPAFVWNHDLVMRQGGRGLARVLGARLVASD